MNALLARLLRAGVLRRYLVIVFVLLLAYFGFRVWTVYAAQLVWVPVPKEDIPVGTQINAMTHLRLVQVPKGYALEESVQHPEDLHGKYAQVLLYKGQPINRRAIGTRPPDSAIFTLPPGHVAFPLIVDKRPGLAAASTFVKKGALIDLIVIPPGPSDAKTTAPAWLADKGKIYVDTPSRVLLTKVRVIDTLKQGGLVWVLDLTADQAVVMTAIDASPYPLYAILTDPANPKMDALLGVGGED